MQGLIDSCIGVVLRAGGAAQWTRFYDSHADINLQKKKMIDELPRNLRTELVQHLYLPMMSRVPV